MRREGRVPTSTMGPGQRGRAGPGGVLDIPPAAYRVMPGIDTPRSFATSIASS